jgi:hypothetical protein
MNFKFVVEFPGLAQTLKSTLTPLLEAAVSALGDKIAKLEATIDAALARVQEDVAGLKTTIDELRVKVEQGTATPEELDRLDRAEAKLAALDPVQDATLNEVPQGGE